MKKSILRVLLLVILFCTLSFAQVKASNLLVIEHQYDTASNFKEGLARVSQDGKYGYIKRTGEMVIPLQYENASDFNNGLAIVRNDRLYGVIDREGNIVIPLEYRFMRLNEGYYEAAKEWNYALYNRYGEQILPEQAHMK